MSRNTHDRQLDHHGPDLDSNIVLSANIGSLTAGTDLHTALASLASSGGGGDIDLLTGDDSTFATSLGNWTATGGTFTRDTTYHLPGFTASAKWQTTTGTPSIQVPIGNVRAGDQIWAILVISADLPDSSVATYRLRLGTGTDFREGSNQIYGVSNVKHVWNKPNWVAVAVQWIPQADTSSATLSLTSVNNSVAATMYIGLAKVIVAAGPNHLPLVYLPSSQVVLWPLLFDAVNARSDIGTPEVTDPGGGGAQLRLEYNGLGLQFNSKSIVQVTRGGMVFIGAAHNVAEDLAYGGLDIEVGPDWLDMYISQKDANTIQLYGYSGTNFELRDNSTGRWTTVSGDGSVAKNINDLTLPSNATPQSVGTSSSAGSSPDASRADHQHALGIGTTKGDILVRTSSGWTRLPIGSDGQVLTADAAQAEGVKWATVSGDGVGSLLTSKGDLLVRTSSGLARLPVGSDGQVLTADATQMEGVKWATPSGGTTSSSGQFIAGFDGGGSVLSAGAYQDVIAPFNGTITGWTILADQSGSAVVDVRKGTYASYPPTPSITGGSPPTLSSANKAQGSATGWTTSVSAGDIIRFYLSSASTVTKLLVVLAYTRT